MRKRKCKIKRGRNLLAFAMLLPFMIGTRSNDKKQSETEMSFGIGTGSYVCTGMGCHGPHTVHYTDVDAKFSHKFKEVPIRLGLTGGYVHEPDADDGSWCYVSPSISFDFKYFAIGGGVGGGVCLDDDDFGPGWRPFPNTNVRIGSKDEVFVFANMFNSVPLYSGGGLLNAGIGVSIFPYGDVRLGVNAFPYEDGGIMGGWEFKVTRNTFMSINGSCGVVNGKGGDEQWGISTNIIFRK